MKQYLPALCMVLCMVSACMKDTVTERYTFYRPVYQTKAAVRANIKSSAAVGIQQVGKIVVKDNVVFLNDIDRGIHLINISNPSRPEQMGFIKIPGCVDIAINGNYLYADCYTDLVTLDISNPSMVVVKQFLGGVFPHRIFHGFQFDTSKVIADWVRVDTVVKERFRGELKSALGNFQMFSSSDSRAFSASFQAGIGVAGSTARFALQQNRMYAVSHDDLKVFNVSTAAAPSYVTAVKLLSGNIETIFPYKDKLFIGSQSGMFIYSNTNPDQPKKLAEFTHARACDPVIADDTHAYVTLRSGSFCTGFVNQLDVIDINVLTAPKLIKSYPLTAPAGLSKDGNLLLVCDGQAGLKILNASQPSQPILIATVPGFYANDVIAGNGLAIVTAKDGLYCIDYSNSALPKVLSKIHVSQ